MASPHLIWNFTSSIKSLVIPDYQGVSETLTVSEDKDEDMPSLSKCLIKILNILWKNTASQILIKWNPGEESEEEM